MHRYFEELKDFRKKGDLFLLVIILIVSAVGLVAITSATSAAKFEGNFRYIAIQSVSIGLGVLMFALVSSVDLEFLSEHRWFPKNSRARYAACLAIRNCRCAPAPRLV